MSGTLVNSSEDGANARNLTIVVFDRFDSRLSGIACGDRRGKNEHVFVLYHGSDVIAEDQLASRRMLGGDHVDSLMCIEVHKVTSGQLFCKAGADDLGSIEAEDGINYSCVIIIGHQFLRDSLSLGKSGLLCRYVNIIIDMAMACCEVTVGHTQKQVFFFCSDLIAACGRHIVSVPKKLKKAPFF